MNGSRNTQRIVVKVGSNVLTRHDGRLDISRMSLIVDQVAEIKQRGFEVIMVSSGAVASGCGELGNISIADNVARRQLFSAVGQVKLLNLYYDLFREHNIPIGQILTMKENFATRREYLNQRACISTMLSYNIVPIVNENDTVSLTELMFTDNDELSGLIASMMHADILVILSDVDGLFNGPPSSPKSSIIRKIEQNCDVEKYIQNVKSGFGRGGMTAKCAIARKVADEGIGVIIANGKRDNILIDIISADKDTPFTYFMPRERTASGVKMWISHSASFAKGKVFINNIAAKALHSEQATSLLLVGVVSIEGDFDEGDIINIVDEKGEKVGLGRSSYSSKDVKQLIGKHDIKPLVHYDYLCLE